MVGPVLGSSLVIAAGAMAYAVRGRSSTLVAPSVYRGNSSRAALALTFDDGPSESTPELLEVLERFDVRATFFQCGIHVRRLPDVARAVLAAGHEIGNHTDQHRPLCLLTFREIREELQRAQESIVAVTGSVPTLFRAPYGIRWFGLAGAQRRLKLTGVMWTTIARDWTLPADGIVERVMGGARNGAIFCLHDGRGRLKRPDIQPTIKAIRECVPRLRDRGFQFETVSQLLCPAT